jgi:hypothetical protein
MQLGEVMKSWLGRFLAWDGILPMLVAAVPYSVVILFPRNDVAELSGVILVSIVAALVRTGLGAQQIRDLCDGKLPMRRQVALAIAIGLLILFEGMVSLLTFADDEPVSAWAYPIVIFLCYLAAAAVAFAPRPTGRYGWIGE